MKKGEEIDVPKGRDINLRCEVARGVPTPDIIWKKDSKNLRSKPISQKISVVKLSNVKPADAGRYVCMARNIAGTHSSDVILTVKCKYTFKFPHAVVALIHLANPKLVRFLFQFERCPLT